MEKIPNKTNSENTNAEKSDGWENFRKFEEQVNAFREARDTARFNELLKARDEHLSWKDSETNGPSTGRAEEDRLDDLLKQHTESVDLTPEKPVELEPIEPEDNFEPIPEEDAKLLLDNDHESEPEEPEAPEPIPEEDAKLLLDNKKDLPPAEELDKARKHQAIELNQLGHQNVAKHQENTQEKEHATHTPLVAINAANKASSQAVKQENLIPADQKLTEDVEYAIKRYAEYKVWLDGRKSTIDDQFKRDMKKVVKKAIEEGRVSPDIEKTDYLDNYLSAAKEAADRFIEVQKEVKNGEQRKAALDNIMDGFQVYDVKESAPASEPILKSPARIITMSPEGAARVSSAETPGASPEAENDGFEKWNEEILKDIDVAKDLIGGYEGVAILTSPAGYSSPIESRHYGEWWDNLPEKGKSTVLNILDKIESSDYRNDLDWGIGFRTWYYSRQGRAKNLEAA